MAEHNRKRVEHGASKNDERQSSIGNQQQTAQTGGQNNGGSNIKDQEDEYTKDLSRSGRQHSSNRKGDR